MLRVPAHITPSSECARAPAAGCCPGPPHQAQPSPGQKQRYSATVLQSPFTHTLCAWCVSPASLLQSSPPVSPSPSPPPTSPPPPPAVGPNLPALKSCSQGLAIPSYFYPGSYWTQAKAAKANIMIINPASGPGAAVDANYVATVTDMKAAGGCGSGVGGVHWLQPVAHSGWPQDASAWKHCCWRRVVAVACPVCMCAWRDGAAVAAGLQAPPYSGTCTLNMATEIRRWCGKTSTSECAWGRGLQEQCTQCAAIHVANILAAAWTRLELAGTAHPLPCPFHAPCLAARHAHEAGSGSRSVSIPTCVPVLTTASYASPHVSTPLQVPDLVRCAGHLPGRGLQPLHSRPVL